MMIEVTESTAMVRAGPHRARSLAMLRDARRAARDRRLRHRPLVAGAAARSCRSTTLKIDRSFVADLPDDRGCGGDRGRRSSSSRTASALQPLAEGIETEAQLDFLLEHGCELGQGFLLGRPVPADELVVAG